MTTVTNLEQQLAGSDAAETRQRLLRHLSDLETQLRGRVRQGLPPDTFMQVVACVDACAAAHYVVQHYRHDPDS